MWYENLFEQLELRRDEVQGKKMSAYMQDKFEFLGIPKTQLKDFIKPYLVKSKKLEFDWKFVFSCWEKPYREAQYIAVEYILMHQKCLTDKDFNNLEKLVTEKSWWETVDSLDAVVGTIVLKYPEHKQLMLKWSVSDNIWLRRVSIDFQQRYKDKTDTELLSKIIENNFNSKEFFINKAIGWSLRDYSKVNAEWVKNYIIKYENDLAPLSVKEASKYI